MVSFYSALDSGQMDRVTLSSRWSKFTSCQRNANSSLTRRSVPRQQRQRFISDAKLAEPQLDFPESETIWNWLPALKPAHREFASGYVPPAEFQALTAYLLRTAREAGLESCRELGCVYFLMLDSRIASEGSRMMLFGCDRILDSSIPRRISAVRCPIP